MSGKICGTWSRGRDGARLYFRNDGVLLACDGPSGERYEVAAGVTLADCHAYARGAGYRRTGYTKVNGDRVTRPIALEPTGKPAPKGDSSQPALTPQQRAEQEARIQAHARRVAADLARIEESHFHEGVA